MGAWTERHTEGAGSLTIDVEAFDVERTERDEMALFKRALSAPRNDPDAFTDKDGVSVSTLEAMRVFVGIASVVALIACFVWTIPTQPSIAALVIGLLAGMILPQVGLSYVYRKRRTRSEKSRAKFTLTLDTDGFALEREGKGATRKMELDVIERFEATQRRIALIDKSGARTLLPLSLATPAENAALADRLNAATMDARASRGGYRGGGPRIATSELEPRSEERGDEEVDEALDEGKVIPPSDGSGAPARRS